MAILPFTARHLDPEVILVSWHGLANGDQGQPYEVPKGFRAFGAGASGVVGESGEVYLARFLSDDNSGTFGQALDVAGKPLGGRIWSSHPAAAPAFKPEVGTGEGAAITFELVVKAA